MCDISAVCLTFCSVWVGMYFFQFGARFSSLGDWGVVALVVGRGDV